MPRSSRHIASILTAATLAAAVVLPAARADTIANEVTISLSGSTAMRGFTTSAFISDFEPGAAPVSFLINGTIATFSPSASTVQLANRSLSGTPNLTTGANTLNLEWHEQGSVEGVYELAFSQNLDGNHASFNVAAPTNANPTWVNGNQIRPSLGNTNLIVQQNKVQMAISDVNAAQGFRSTSSTGAKWNATINDSGYGYGNAALPVSMANEPPVVVGTPTFAANTAHQLADKSILGGHTLDNSAVAVTATLFVANPGTGLTRINKTDAQWLQTSGRLQNGVDLNFTSRDVTSGTRNVAATNTGVDASWAVGENDNGLGSGGAYGAAGVVGQMSFSNKTTGGNLRTTLTNNRFSVGTLGFNDALNRANGIIQLDNSSSAPLRALDYANSSSDPIANNDPLHPTLAAANRGDTTNSTQWVRASARNIVTGAYNLFQNEQYITVSDGAGGVLGDDAAHSVQNFKNMVLSSVSHFPNTTSFSTPADGLVANNFILPQLMVVNRTTDGGTISLNASVSTDLLYGSSTGGTIDAPASGSFLDPSVTNGAKNFAYTNPGDVTFNAAGTKYGAGSTIPAANQVAITATNYVGGDFNQTGIRDYSAVQSALSFLKTTGSNVNLFTDSASSVTASATYSLTNGGSATITRGDAVVLGDVDSRGVFDGRSLYLLAHMAVADASSTGNTLTVSAYNSATNSGGYGDAIRQMNILRKNAALDYLQSNTTASSFSYIRTSARTTLAGTAPAPLVTAGLATQLGTGSSATFTLDAAGANAFNKSDVNRDGLVDVNDALIVDKFLTNDYTSIDQSLAATIHINGSTDTQAAGQMPINLVDVSQIDRSASHTAIDQGDLTIVNNALTGTVNNWWHAPISGSSGAVKSGGGTISVNATAGTTYVETGAKLAINAGTFSAGGAADPFTDNTGGATTGNHLSIVNNASLAITAGDKTIGTLDQGPANTGVTTISTGASLTATSIRQHSATLNGAAVIAPRTFDSALRLKDGSPTVSVLTSLTISGPASAPAGKLDLNNNDLIIQSGSASSATDYANARAWLAAGRNGATSGTANWNGTGIISSYAKAHDPSGTDLFTLALLRNGDLATLGSGVPFTSFDGQSVTNDAILIKYTFNGDVNLDGKVDGNDYGVLDSTFLNQSRAAQFGYESGDLNGDGKVDGNDYGIVDTSFLNQSGPLAASEILAHETLFGASYLNNFSAAELAAAGITPAAVPEPASLALLALGSAVLLCKRRQK